MTPQAIAESLAPVIGLLLAQSSEQLLTLRQAAEALSVDASYVGKLIKRGELPQVRVGRKCIRVRRSDLDVFIQRRVTLPRAIASVSDAFRRRTESA